MAKATVIAAVAFVVISCKNKLATTEAFDISKLPVQVVDSMFVLQTDKGNMKMRMEAAVMERYDNDTLAWEEFPKGFHTYSYDDQGRLESSIRGDRARHSKHKKKKDEIWVAYGNVVVRNLINEETMETDTLYWDPDSERIYTDSYVKLTAPSGMMQGFGMESDQRARSSVIMRPFNSFGLVSQDSTLVVLDSVNFIGPFPKK